MDLELYRRDLSLKMIILRLVIDYYSKLGYRDTRPIGAVRIIRLINRDHDFHLLAGRCHVRDKSMKVEIHGDKLTSVSRVGLKETVMRYSATISYRFKQYQ